MAAPPGAPIHRVSESTNSRERGPWDAAMIGTLQKPGAGTLAFLRGGQKDAPSGSFAHGVMGAALLLASGIALAATFVGTNGPDTIIGTDSADTIAGLGGDDFINGRGGDDGISGGDGEDTVSGGYGNDSVSGGPGNDQLAGDAIGGTPSGTGTFGNDRVSGEDGDDDIGARDGRVVYIACGPGTDTVFADDIDRIARDCENVTTNPVF